MNETNGPSGDRPDLYAELLRAARAETWNAGGIPADAVLLRFARDPGVFLMLPLGRPREGGPPPKPVAEAVAAFVAAYYPGAGEVEVSYRYTEETDPFFVPPRVKPRTAPGT